MSADRSIVQGGEELDRDAVGVPRGHGPPVRCRLNGTVLDTQTIEFSGLRPYCVLVRATDTYVIQSDSAMVEPIPGISVVVLGQPDHESVRPLHPDSLPSVAGPPDRRCLTEGIVVPSLTGIEVGDSQRDVMNGWIVDHDSESTRVQPDDALVRSPCLLARLPAQAIRTRTQNLAELPLAARQPPALGCDRLLHWEWLCDCDCLPERA